MILRLRKQNVNMVAHGINFDEPRIVIFQDASNISVQLAALFIAQERAAVFCAKYEMDNNVGE